MSELEHIDRQLVEIEVDIAYAERDGRGRDVAFLKTRRHALLLKRRHVERLERMRELRR